MITRRQIIPERLDDPHASREEIDASFRFIRLVNARLGGIRVLLRELEAERPRWPIDRPLRLLDLGTGVGDLPRAALRWADRRGLRLECMGIDLHPAVVELARREHADEPRLEIRALDAHRAVEEFGDASFDVVHAGMFLHHLPDAEILTVLRVMDRLARRRLVWNDLRRSALNRWLVWLLALPWHPSVRHDASVSVAKGFVASEMREFARRLELPSPRVRRAFAGRMVLVSTRRELGVAGQAGSR